ncbi:hypothetical protein TorRG33x02_236560 [Trema orientale]|uniref:Uncharacterized protein n=1 Tax=Trema orientale TaxID=63057 RepID=A0A2P5E0S4_TREOI|nr:hypothetical protein TorRG33x02_236560 [Trema orientale]
MGTKGDKDVIWVGPPIRHYDTALWGSTTQYNLEYEHGRSTTKDVKWVGPLIRHNDRQKNSCQAQHSTR